jgi:hypothetical protein
MSKDFSDAYLGAREEVLIWKKRALEAEARVREQDLIIERLGDALNEENGPTRMGEPHIADENGVRAAVSFDGAYRFNPLTGQHE